MAKQVSSERKKRRKPLSPEEVAEKYSALRKAEETADQESAERIRKLVKWSGWDVRPATNPVEELARSVEIRLLRQAAADKDLEGCKVLLLNLLRDLGVDLPNGVLSKWPKLGKPGRPLSPETARIYELWVEIGEPSPSSSDLAKAFFGMTYTDANGRERRRMRDACRRAVERAMDREIQELKRVVAELQTEYKRLAGETKSST